MLRTLPTLSESVVNVPAAAVPPPIAPGLANVAPLREEAFRFATLVVLETANGAVPVDTVEVNCPLTLRLVPVAAPITGVTNVGLMLITNVEPVPVCDPTDVAFPTEVMTPVRLALVVTVPAVNPAAVPEQFVRTPLAGVPRAGVTSVLFQSVSVPASVASVPLTAGSVRVTEAVWASVVLNAPVVARFPASASCPVVTVSAVPDPLTTTARPPLPDGVGRRANPAAIATYSARIGADAPLELVAGVPDGL